MEPTPPCGLEPLYTTLDKIRAEHSRLLDLDSGDEAPGPEFWVEARGFATRVAESGIYFDEPHEVKACQGYLSYWERELARAKAEKCLSSALDIPALKPYDEAALRALQPLYTNPFEHFAVAAKALPKADARTHSSEELARLIEGKAAGAGLRFELDLAKEIVAQVAGDTYAPTLVEFCLHHLFEDPETRIGNKLRRPPNERSFSCLQYLIDQTDRIYRNQGPIEQRAMLDALSEYGAGYDPAVPSDALIPQPRIDAVKGAASPTFKDTVGHALALRPFLVSSRVLFERGTGLSIVHPALFRRWPELLAAISTHRERARNRVRQRISVGIILALVVGLAWVSIAQWTEYIADENRRQANELAAGASFYLWKYDACRVREKSLQSDDECDSANLLEGARSKALDAVTKYPTRRAMATLNRTLGAMLGANVQTWQEGKLTGKPLALHGNAPGINPCPPERAGAVEFCFVNSEGRSVMLRGLRQADTLFATDAGEKVVAVAWPTSGGTSQKVSKKVGLEAFGVGKGDTAEPVGRIRDTRCDRSAIEHVRVSADGRMVTVDCAPSRQEVQPMWDVVSLSDGSPVSLSDLKSKYNDSSIIAVYFASPGKKGHAALQEGGVLEVIGDSAKNVMFQSEILRVMGRPDDLAFHSNRGFAALGTFGGPPLVMVHQAEKGRDTIYITPEGLGTPRRVDYSPNGQCIEVRTVDQEGQYAFAYHIVLDPKVLMEVAKQMGGSTPRYEARSLCGFL